ncbi:hypothetical protein [Lentibacillus saliphilus]|uniref:hypothetical protein n=1 Tax=Lentibacillus saliphilus TaxID=2737028 RepID=UPI001C2F33B9|nr:hypothetical protein [Lentibacillus saliphilus]
MKQLTIGVVLLVVGILTGCQLIGGGDSPLSGNQPPEVYVKISNEKHPTMLGTYCWSGECVDTVGPVELLKGQAPLPVQPGEPITLGMNFSPKPNELHLLQIKDGKETEVDIANNRFTAPTEPGVYYYSYGVWWMDAEEENVAHGDAFYAFAVEVE